MTKEVGLSKQAYAAVQKVFAAETAAVFGFLATEFGLAGPEHQGAVLPVITFAGQGVRYRIMLDSDDKMVITRVEIDLGTKRLVAGLDNLVLAAGLGTPNVVAQSAPTPNALRHALESQATYVRLLQPHMRSENVIELMRAASAREWNVR
jgi:hypothetical protein